MRAALLLLTFSMGLGAQALLPSRVLLQGQSGCVISTGSLPPATFDAPYLTSLSTLGCASPVTWDLASGTLCTGLALGSAGTIIGTPTVVQTCTFTARATDNSLVIATRVLSLSVQSATTSTGSTLRKLTVRGATAR